MIRLVQVRGEGYDVETGAKTSKALVLSNGRRSVDVPASDELVTQILQLLVEGVEQPDPTPEAEAELDYPGPGPVPSTFEEEPAPPVALFKNEEPKNVSYEDELTGVGSI